MNWENEVDEPADKLANKLSRKITMANNVYLSATNYTRTRCGSLSETQIN